jgi:hypothetical protein
MIKPIETEYKGYRFRSRLEARWAIFFDAFSLDWDYEKEGFDLGDGIYYLPDFWINDTHCWIEIKPTKPSKEEIEKCRRLADNTEWFVMLLPGTPSELLGRLDQTFYVWTKDEEAELGSWSLLGLLSNELRPIIQYHIDANDEEFIRAYVEMISTIVNSTKKARFEHGR